MDVPTPNSLWSRTQCKPFPVFYQVSKGSGWCTMFSDTLTKSHIWALLSNWCLFNYCSARHLQRLQHCWAKWTASSVEGWYLLTALLGGAITGMTTPITKWLCNYMYQIYILTFEVTLKVHRFPGVVGLDIWQCLYCIEWFQTACENPSHTFFMSTSNFSGEVYTYMYSTVNSLHNVLNIRSIPAFFFLTTYYQFK